MVIKNILFIVALTFSLSACQKNEYVYSLSDTQIIQILADLHTSEAMTKNFDITLRDSVSKLYYKQILEIHEVSEKVFTNDFEELKRNPTKLELIYKQIDKKLEEKKEQAFDK